jgi:hypothetical protein
MNATDTGGPLTADSAYTALVDGRTILDLAEGLQLRRVRVMGANRIELTGFHDTMRNVCAPMACSARSSRGSCASSCRSTPPVPPSSASCSTPIRSRASPRRRLRDGSSRRFRPRASSRPTGRGGVPALSLQRPSQGNYWRCDAQQGPLDVRPAEGFAQRPGRQMDRRRHRRTWRSARRDPRNARPHRLRRIADEARDFLSLPRPEPEPAPHKRNLSPAPSARPRRHGDCSPCRSRSSARS